MSRKNRSQSHPSAAAASDELHDEDKAEGHDEGGLAADDVEAAEGFVPAGAPTSGATPVTLPTGIDTPLADAPTPSELRLQAQIDELKALLSTSAAAGTVAPPGYKLVKDEPGQDAKSLAEQAALRAEIDKGTRQRTQEHANRLFPEGKHVYRCLLAADKNDNPELLIRAANPTDAVARYLAACGINHTEHKVVVNRA